MNSAIIILIVIIILTILAGIGVTIYFLFIKKSAPPGPRPSPSPPGPTPTPTPPGPTPTPTPPGPTPTPTPPGPTPTPPGPTPTPTPTPPGIIPGIFAISPVSAPNEYIGIDGNLRLISTSDRSLPCEGYQWKNLSNYNPLQNGIPIFSTPISSGLATVLPRLTENGVLETAPPEFLVYSSQVQIDSPPYIIYGPSITQISNAIQKGLPSTAFDWIYDPVAKTWCNPVSPSGGNQCLYRFPQDNVIYSVPFSPGDVNFEWNIVTPPVPPYCANFT